MLSRQTIMVLSVLATTALHGLVFGIAAHLPLQGFRPPPPKTAPAPFHVQFREESTVPPVPNATESRKGKGSNLATRPERIEDLLKQETDVVKAPESSLGKITEVPDLAGRLAQESLPRNETLEPDLDALERVDAKVIEIAEASARSGIEIPRRLARPSSERIVGENEFPVLAGASDGLDGAVSLGGMPTVSLLDAPVHPRGESADGHTPPTEEAVVLEPANVSLPALPQIETIMRAPTVKEIAEERPYEFMDDMVDIGIETYVPPAEKEGFFRLRIVPKKNATMPVLPKDITFVIDASNSIVQRKLDATIKGTRGAVGDLKPEDRFNIVVFRDSPGFFQPELVMATPENVAAADKFLANVRAHGETDVYSALRPVMQTAPREGVSGLVVVVTDGRPTVGVRDTRAIINDLTQANILGNEIVAYGGGNTVNRYLLDLLAYRNRGESRVETSIDSIVRDLPAFVGQFSEPILADLHADYSNIDTGGVFPKALPDFRKQRVVTVYGRFNPKKDGELAMRLSGRALSKKKEILFRADLRKATTGDTDIARNWAFQKVYYLIGEMCREGEKPELMNEMRQLSQKYGIRTSYDE